MTKSINCRLKDTCVITIFGVSLLLAASSLRAEERLPASEIFSAETKEFLSDPARTGSLLGSILAGAAVANPLAPILGSVAGFMIGKSSAFSDKDKNATRRDAFLNRSLVPEDGLEAISLTGLTGNPSQPAKQLVISEIHGDSREENLLELSKPETIGESSRETGAISFSEHSRPLVMVELPEDIVPDDPPVDTEQLVSSGLTGHTQVRSELQRQLADQCSNVQLSQPMPTTCYYYSQ